MRKRTIRILDLIIDTIESMQDYIITRQITLSEGFLFGVTLSVAIWATVIGTSIVPYSTAALWIISVAHFFSFFSSSILIRIIICLVLSLIWGIIAFLAALAQMPVFIFPILIWLSVLAAFIVIRLYHDHKTNKANARANA